MQAFAVPVLDEFAFFEGLGKGTVFLENPNILTIERAGGKWGVKRQFSKGLRLGRQALKRYSQSHNAGENKRS